MNTCLQTFSSILDGPFRHNDYAPLTHHCNRLNDFTFEAESRFTKSQFRSLYAGNLQKLTQLTEDIGITVTVNLSEGTEVAVDDNLMTFSPKFILGPSKMLDFQTG